MKQTYFILILLLTFVSINSWSQDCPCSNLNLRSGISYVNDWQYDKDGTGHVVGIIPYNGKCHEFTGSHFKIVRTYKDGKMISVDSLKVPYISWNNYHSGDSVSLQELKKLKNFSLVNTDPSRVWNMKKFDIYFTKEEPDVITDSSRISRMTSNYFHGKKCRLGPDALLYLKNAGSADFDYVKIIPTKVLHKNVKNELIDEYVLYLKKE